MKRSISLALIALSISFFTSCNKNDESPTQEATEEATPLYSTTSIFSSGDIGYLDGSTFIEVSKNGYENFLAHTYNETSVTSYEHDIVSYQDNSTSPATTRYYIISSYDGRRILTEVDYDGGSGEYRIVGGNKTVSCSSTHCVDTECQPTSLNGVLDCSSCPFTCTRTVTLTTDPDEDAFLW